MEATNETGKSHTGAQSRGAEGGTNLSGGLAADTQWQCTICGQIGTVGRCCKRDARLPLNELARQEAQCTEADNV